MRPRSDWEQRLSLGVYRRHGEARVNGKLTLIIGFAIVVAFAGTAQTRDFEMGGDSSYPNSIMAPEPGAHRPLHSTKPLSSQTFHHHFRYAHGSSGSVLPTPLPKTQALPPVGSSIPQAKPATTITEQGPTILPNGSTVPNLPHGQETFQDRASRCAHQQGLNNIPGSASNQYMTACLQ
jgi:hypothetical protein